MPRLLETLLAGADTCFGNLTELGPCCGSGAAPTVRFPRAFDFVQIWLMGMRRRDTTYPGVVALAHHYPFHGSDTFCMSGDEGDI